MGSLELKGFVRIQTIDRDGNVVNESSGENMITDAGKVLVAESILSGGSSIITHIGMGSGNSPTKPTSTRLDSETAVRVLATSSRSNNSISFHAFFEANNGTGTIAEFGLFNAANEGTMFSRYITTPSTKAADQRQLVIWEIHIQ